MMRCRRISSVRRNKKRFGMNVPADQRKHTGSFDFEEKYPEDAIYEELGPNARVWRANMDECELFDNDMIIEARDGLDLLLVFAGLFSAVLTTFVAQTSQALSNNFLAVSTSLLAEMVSIQRAQLNGTSVDKIPMSKMTSGPSSFDVWVNALWFTSLTLSLGTALIAVLVKQWLYQYMLTTSGTPRDRSLIRHYRFTGLRKWRVLTIIGVLPIVLHVALGLFLAGLVTLLVPLNVPLACIIGFITTTIFALYTISNAMSVLDTQCPYRTPFSDILNFHLHVVQCSFSSVLAAMTRLFSPICLAPISTARKFCNLKDAERIAATDDKVAEAGAHDALLWLYQTTSNPPTKSVILQSVGCFSDLVLHSLHPIIYEDLEQHIQRDTRQASPWKIVSILPGRERRVERLLRAFRQYKSRDSPFTTWAVSSDLLESPFNIVAAILTHADIVCVSPGEGQAWRAHDVLARVLEESPESVHFPDVIWKRLVTSLFHPAAPTSLVARTCRIGLANFPKSSHLTPSFSSAAAVPISTFPLGRCVYDIFSAHSGKDYGFLDSAEVKGLFALSDLVVSKYLSNRDGESDSDEEVISTLQIIWQSLSFHNSAWTPNDCRAICLRAEDLVLQNLPLVNADVVVSEALQTYFYILGKDGRGTLEKSWEGMGVPSPKFVGRVFSEFYTAPSHESARVLRLALHRDVVAAYHSFLMYTFNTTSPVTVVELDLISPVVAAFTDGLTRGALPLGIVDQCMEYILHEPRRLFSVCQMLAMGRSARDVEIRTRLVNLARLCPRHVSWRERARYMSLEVTTYFRLDDLEALPDLELRRLEDRKKFALRVLDEFFV